MVRTRGTGATQRHRGSVTDEILFWKGVFEPKTGRQWTVCFGAGNWKERTLFRHVPTWIEPGA